MNRVNFATNFVSFEPYVVKVATVLIEESGGNAAGLFNFLSKSHKNFSLIYTNMNSDLITVKPGEGLGILKFGMTRQEVADLIGEPDEIEVSADYFDGEELVDVWHYDQHEFSIVFREDPESKLENIACSSPNIILLDNKLINKSFDEITKFISQNQFGEYNIENFKEDEEDVTLLHFPDIELSFWFDSGILTEIQWNVCE